MPRAKKKILSKKSNGFKKSKLIYFLFVLIIVPFALYIKVASYDFSKFDDTDIILGHYSTISDLKNIKEAFTHDAFMSNNGDSFYRPVQTVSFMLDAQVGGQKAWIYHLSNLLIHILTVIVLYFFLRKLGINEIISFFLSLLYSIHPLFTHAVAWIPARGDLLVCLFGMLSIITTIEYFRTHKFSYLILHLFFYFLAVFSKETALLIPLIILMYYYFVLKRDFVLKRIAVFFAVWISVSGLFYYIRQEMVNVKFYSDTFGLKPFIKNLPALPVAISKFFFPYNLCTMPAFDLSATITGILLLASISIMAFRFLREEKRIIIWGFVWFFVFSIPPMFFRNNNADIGYEYFEHRTYFPLIGILVVIGILLKQYSQRFSYIKLAGITIPVYLIFGAIAFSHTEAFANPVSFFSSGINNNPGNAVAYNARGILYRDDGNFDKALYDFDNSVRICSTYSAPYFSKGDLYKNTGNYAMAEHYYSLALKYDTLYNNNSLHENSYLSLSAIMISMKRYDEAKVVLINAERLYTGSYKVANNRGIIYLSESKYDSAMISFNKALNLEPDPVSYNYRAIIKYHAGNYGDAITDLDMALKLNPEYRDAWTNRGITNIAMKDYGGAISDFNISLSLDPQSGEVYQYRGTAFFKMNKQIEAEKDFAEARKHGYINAK